MNSKFLSYFKRKRAFLAVTLVGGIALSGVIMKNASSQKAELSVLGEGVQTCFLRANQTHTAKLLGQTGLEYLASGFFAATEECFAEALGTAKTKFQAEGKGLIRDLNTLSSEVHNFHQKLKSPDEKLENISALFSKIETLKDDVLEESDAARTSLNSSFDQARQIFFLLCGLFPLLFVWELIERRRNESRMMAIEEEALKQLGDGRARLDSQMEAVIKRALEFSEFVNCARLFENWSENRLVTTHKVYNELPVPKKTQDFVIEEPRVAEEIHEDVLEPVVGLKEVAIEPLLAKVVDHLSSRIFTSGIMLDLDVSEDLKVMGREETVEQLFFHTILRSVNALSDTSGVRRLRISAKLVGQTAVLELTDNGDAFSSDLLDAQVGLASVTNGDLELTLTRELTKELGGQIILENVLKGREAIGGKVKIRLMAANVEGKRLVSLKKGKKKDLMRELAH